MIIIFLIGVRNDNEFVKSSYGNPIFPAKKSGMELSSHIFAYFEIVN